MSTIKQGSGSNGNCTETGCNIKVAFVGLEGGQMKTRAMESGGTKNLEETSVSGGANLGQWYIPQPLAIISQQTKSIMEREGTNFLIVLKSTGEDREQPGKATGEGKKKIQKVLNWGEPH